MGDCWTTFEGAGGFTKQENIGLFLDAAACEGSDLGNVFVLLILCIIFALIYLVYVKYVDSLVPPTPTGGPPQAVWVWDDSGVPSAAGKFLSSQLVLDAATQAAYLIWAAKVGIVQQWFDPNPDTLGNSAAEIGSFLATCKKMGISTQFLCTSADPGQVSTAIADTKARIDLLVTLSKTYDLQKDLGVTGLQSDLEWVGPTKPGVAPVDATTLYNTQIQMQGMMTKELGTQMKFAASVGDDWIPWGDPNNPPMVTTGEKSIQYGVALLQAGIDVTVQCYLDFNPKTWSYNSYLPIEAWCAAAVSAGIGSKAYIGVCVGPGPGFTYFDPTAHNYTTNLKQLVSDLNLLQKQFAANIGFGGVAVHDAFFYGYYSW